MIIECPNCGAVYDGHRWIPEPGEELFKESNSKKKERKKCPGCQAIEKKQVEGVLTLKGGFIKDHRDEIKNVVNRVAKNRGKRNVLSRILGMNEDNGAVIIETTDEHLAEMMGKEVQKAFKGNLEMKWQEKSAFVRVVWERD